MSIFHQASRLLRRCAGKAMAGAALAAATLLPAAHSTPAHALAGAPFEGRYSMSAEHVCPANRVVYEMEFYISDAGLLDLQGRWPLNPIYFQLDNRLPAGLKWESFTVSGDAISIDGGPLSGAISSIAGDNDRLVIEHFVMTPGDANGDGQANTVRVTAVAELLPGVPLPRTFSHTAELNIGIPSGGAFPMKVAGPFHSVPPGDADGTIKQDDSLPTEVTVESDCAGVPPVPPLEGEACLSADYDVFCGPVPGTHNVILSGATVAEDFVAVTVLTPGVLIDNGGFPTDTVAIPVVAGTYFADLIITGAAPGSLVTFAISGDGDVGVLEELPGGFAVCCTTQVIVAIPEVCDEPPEGPLPGPVPEDDPVEPEGPGDDPERPGDEPRSDWDLELRKSVTTDDATCRAGEQCIFELMVTNRGPDRQRGDIVISDVVETTEIGRLMDFVPPAPWSCRLDGASMSCTYPDANLPVGASIALRIPTVVAADPIGDELLNCALIEEGDAVGREGDENNKDCATVTILDGDRDPEDPPRDDPEKDLGIRKSGPDACLAGLPCTFHIKLTNESSELYQGEIVFSDVPSDPGVRYLDHSPSGWQCEDGPAAVVCRAPNARLEPGASTSVALRMIVPNTGSLTRSGFENCGYLGGETGAGANARPGTRAVQQTLLDLGYNPGPVDGQFGPRTQAALRDFQRANDLRVTGTPNEPTLEALGLTGETDEEPYRDAFADDNAFCIPVDVRARPQSATPPPAPRPQPEQTTPTCPRGQEFRRGRCRDIVRGCPRGKVLVNGRCVTLEVQCPSGTRRVNGQCVPEVLSCPSGQIRINGQCVPIVLPCPRGQERVNGVCRPREVKCPSGYEPHRGTCRPINNNNNQGGQTTRPGSGQTTVPQPSGPRCKRGETLINGRCVRLQIQIPQGGIQIPGGGTLRIQ